MKQPPLDKDLDLDEQLNALGKCYERSLPPPDAVEKLLQKFHAENRDLTDDELDWLAAAGTGLPPTPKD